MSLNCFADSFEYLRKIDTKWSAVEPSMTLRVSELYAPFQYEDSLDQKDSDSCYAFTIKGMIDSYILKYYGVNFKVATFWLVLLYNPALYSGIIGGFDEDIEKIFKGIQSYGACEEGSFTEKIFPQRDEFYSNNFLNAYRRIKRTSRSTDYKVNALKKLVNGEQSLGVRSSYNNNYLKSMINGSLAYRSWRGFFGSFCKDVYHHENFNIKYDKTFVKNIYGETIISFDNFIKKIMTAFSVKDPLPVYISYNGATLRKVHPESKKITHASMIIGFREKLNTENIKGLGNARYEVLIRNSWGPSCSKYYDGWECDEYGQVWVDANRIFYSAKLLMTLEPPL